MSGAFGQGLWLLALVGLGFLSWATCANLLAGLRRGAIRTGFSVGKTIYRSAEPSRYWRSVVWNALKAAFWVTVFSIRAVALMTFIASRV